MNQLINVDTERIFDQLRTYREEFVSHPFFRAARANQLPLPLLREFASYQYADSVLWIPMLALLRSKVRRSTVLQQSIEKNIACEAGLGGTSHVSMAADMMRSLGASEHTEWACRSEAVAVAMTEWLSEEFEAMTEPAVAGWLLVAEALVPVMFERMQFSFARIPGCELGYFTEHVHVDEAEHAEWMAASVRDVLRIYGPSEGSRHVLRGMASSWDEVLEVPTRLHEKFVAG